MAKASIEVPTGIGPRFSDDLHTAGLAGKRIVVSGQNTIYYEDDPAKDKGLTSADVTALNALISSHDPDLPALPDEDMQKRDQAVAYAQSLIDMTAGERTVEQQSQRYLDFLDTIVELSVEGI